MRTSVLTMFQSLPLMLFTSINNILLQDSFFVSIATFDQEIKMIKITSTRIIDVRKKQNFIVSVHTNAR